MSSPSGTLTRLFFDALAKHGRKPAAFRYRTGNGWKDITYPEVEARVRAIAAGLQALGVKAGDRVALLSENRPEWALTDYACLCAGAADVPIYPTLPPNQVEYILKDSGAVVCLVSNAEQLAKVLQSRAACPALKQVVVFDTAAKRDGAMSLADLEAQGGKAPNARWKDAALAVKPDDLATLIYTSGTTGDPKGVMLTHNNFYSNVFSALQVFDIGPEDSCLSFLPLSHSFERMAGHYTMFAAGATINYAESIDTVPRDLGEVRPTVVLSVPRLYEKMYARVLENALSGSAIKKSIFIWAKRTAEQWAALVLAGKAVPAVLEIKRKLAHKLVFSKLHARTGGRLRFFVSGGAALSPEIAKFFFAAGLPILEGYGLTETAPVISANPLRKVRIGTVGPAIPGVQVKIAADGEILCKGPNVMKGYFNRPEATKEAIDADGWFHTGDIGELDADGYIKITDRKKDLFKTSGGKYIAPQPIENKVKTNKFVSNAVVVGDGRKFPLIIVVPNFDNLEKWARERGLQYSDRRALNTMPDVQAKMEREVMGELRDLAKFEIPKKVLLLDQDFTIESGELTPTLKVKRRVVEKRLKDRIERVYMETPAPLEVGG
jgi:long-chain acyl-CoA synthetase